MHLNGKGAPLRLNALTKDQSILSLFVGEKELAASFKVSRKGVCVCVYASTRTGNRAL